MTNWRLHGTSDQRTDQSSIENSWRQKKKNNYASELIIFTILANNRHWMTATVSDWHSVLINVCCHSFDEQPSTNCLSRTVLAMSRVTSMNYFTDYVSTNTKASVHAQASGPVTPQWRNMQEHSLEYPIECRNKQQNTWDKKRGCTSF